jgi:cytochrome bd-type quinol oxidase subunit 1
MYFMSNVVDAALESEAMMKSSTHRFWAIEHMVGMLLGAILITIGWSKAKKAIENAAKFKKIAVFYTIGFIIILATIPWPFREMFEGRSWFPGS